MVLFNARIEVRFKLGVLDPQGETIKNALLNLGFLGIKSINTGKTFRVNIEAETVEKARQVANDLADRLLANPVIEDFQVEISQ
jgi:phosphoribosylformylglycinamidine synthase